MGYFNLHIVDNNSSYAPLIEYLGLSRRRSRTDEASSRPFSVYRMQRNFGPYVLWRVPAIAQRIPLEGSRFILTEGDIVFCHPLSGRDFALRYSQVLDSFPISEIFKIGPLINVTRALVQDTHIVRHEKDDVRHAKAVVAAPTVDVGISLDETESAPSLWSSEVDTHTVMYRAGSHLVPIHTVVHSGYSIRMGPPYQVYHLPYHYLRQRRPRLPKRMWMKHQGSASTSRTQRSSPQRTSEEQKLSSLTSLDLSADEVAGRNLTDYARLMFCRSSKAGSSKGSSTRWLSPEAVSEGLFDTIVVSNENNTTSTTSTSSQSLTSVSNDKTIFTSQSLYDLLHGCSREFEAELRFSCREAFRTLRTGMYGPGYFTRRFCGR
ncbi:unnamed protein product [Amoebophrya sp. A25]|nr:unnamed protein product [Amoebophrya sp. A25]|eukprot:GSA25T00015559001.1